MWRALACDRRWAGTVSFVQWRLPAKSSRSGGHRIILRELLAGSHRFNQLQRGIPRISRALLAGRLRALETAGVVTSAPLPGGRGRNYQLTAAGEEFRIVIEGLGAWGQRWTVRVDPHHLDGGFLMWNIRRRIAVDRLPPRRVIVRFDFRGVPPGHRGPRTFWLRLERPEPDLCLTDPGFEVELCVSADLATMAKVWLGRPDSGKRAALAGAPGDRPPGIGARVPVLAAPESLRQSVEIERVASVTTAGGLTTRVIDGKGIF